VRGAAPGAHDGPGSGASYILRELSRDTAVFLWIVISFAVFVTAHVTLAFGLTVRKPAWRGPVSLLLVPMAPYWGYLEGLRARTYLWAFGLGSYLTALYVAYRSTA
jgi:hypothetical protein